MSAPATRSDITEFLADSLMAAQFCREAGSRAHWGRYAGMQHPAAAAAYDVEVDGLLQSSRPLRRALRRACQTDETGEPEPAARAHFVELLEHELANGQSHVKRSLGALLGVEGQGPPHEYRAVRNGSSRRPAARRRRDPAPGSIRVRAPRSVRRLLVPLLLLNAIIAAALAAGPALHVLFGSPLPTGDSLELALAGFTVWALSFIPGWLLVRFLDRRAGALWDEYVIHLHRLGLDRPGNLPEPPRTSAYYARWRADGGLARLGMRNIYREKFDAYYGPSVSRFGTDADRPVRSEALFPVFLCTAILAVGWTAILYDAAGSFSAVADPTVWTVLSFAFMGAYVYFLQALMRRYFQADLRAGAYVSGYIRIVTALLVTTVLAGTLFPQLPAEAALSIAFIVGWFPDVGVRWLLRVASRGLRGRVPSMDPAYPLNRLDGLNVWYEARLLEEGIEDLQNLATAKVVDVLLHTRVPVARLVDWIDQALLLIHLPAESADRSEGPHDGEGERVHPRHRLRQYGVRSATALLRALHPDRDEQVRAQLLDALAGPDFPRAAIETLYEVIAADPRLAVVINWQEGDVEARGPVRLGPLPYRSRRSVTTP